MEQLIKLLQRLKEEFPTDRENHTITLSPSGENLQLHIFYEGKWISGFLVGPIEVEADIITIHEYIESLGNENE